MDETTDEAPKQLSFRMSTDVAARLVELRAKVREVGHHRPSEKVLVEALIWAAGRDGRQLEIDVIAPYRVDHPDAE